MELEDRLAIATPEGVELELTLAGLGSRAIAGFVDLTLKALIIAALAIVFFVALSEGLAIAVVTPLAFVVLIFYDVAFEVWGQGRTPGKRWTGLRVLRSSGRPVDVRASAIRNLLRIIDGIPLSYVPTVVAIIVTRRNQRVGDLAADTIVVRDRRGAPAAAAVLAPPAVPSGWLPPGATWDVSAISRDDVAAVSSFLARRDSFAPRPAARWPSSCTPRSPRASAAPTRPTPSASSSAWPSRRRASGRRGPATSARSRRTPGARR
jgi:uncharacterized RDD family membrane protein YckC